MTEILHQNPQLKNGNCTKLITVHFIKLEEEIDGYFRKLGEDELMCLKNHFTANPQVLQAGIGK